MLNERIKEIAAIVMIGDGVLGVVSPRRHLKLWYRGPAAWQKLVSGCLRHTGLIRLMGVAEVAAGIWLAQREWERVASEPLLPAAQPSRPASRLRAVMEFQ